LLFLDDEGTEMGGLVWGGASEKTGKVAAEGHLSFDQYMQDQIFSIDAGREGERRWSVMAFTDRGDYPITEALDFAKQTRALPASERAAAWAKFSKTHPGDNNRVVIGRASDNSSVLRLKDPEGRDRIVLKVDGSGEPSVQMLDAEGKVISQLPLTKSP
jgi:ribonucleotide reductase alpha subunit